MQELGEPLAERVAELGDHRGQLPVGPVAPVEADRVEDVAEHTELRQHQHALDLDSVLGAEAGRCLAHGQRAVEVIGVAQRDEVAAVDREQRQPPLELGQLVQVEDEERDRVAERVPRRLAAGVDQRAGVERRLHQSTPSAAAARTAEASPSSWKPLPRCAPA